MKKILAGVAALVALSYSTTVLADTPVVREMNDFDHILTVATKNRALTNNASEFVIYHQEAGRPCPHKKEKGMHEGKKHHHGKHHQEEGKKSEKHAHKMNKDHHKKADAQKAKTEDNSGK